MTLVSVVIPTYNSADYLPTAIRSVLEQTVADLELIVADDGSTDNTAEVIAAFSDSRLKYILLDHRGRSCARNSGIELATGKFVAFLDADDWWKREKLAKQLSLFEQNERLGLVYCWFRQIGPSGQTLRLVKGIDGVGTGQGDWIFNRLLFGDIGAPSTMLVSRECLDQIGGFRPDLAYAEDWEFCLRIANQFPIGFVPDDLVFYRVHGLYLPEKSSKLEMANASLAAVKNALSIAGVSSNSPIHREAIANTLWNCCLVSVAIDDFESAEKYLSEALLLCPEKFHADRRISLAQSVGYFVNNCLYDTLTPLDEASTYVDKLFKRLNKTCPTLSASYQPSLGWTYAIHAFEGKEFGMPNRTRHSFWRAMMHDSMWIRNIGLWSIGIRALCDRNRKIADTLPRN